MRTHALPDTEKRFHGANQSWESITHTCTRTFTFMHNKLMTCKAATVITQHTHVSATPSFVRQPPPAHSSVHTRALSRSR
mmetsp:Transcript_10222/g.29540  ORF Transcript_10222/g.29540 Transcript_10222/m.29540 type:complete len:80 (+) Transcript_10222:561-800(+)